MAWILIGLVLAGSPDPHVACVPAPQAATVIAAEVQTGSLIVSQGDCLAIKVYTRSQYTHVAAVVIRNDEPIVYDTASGAGVRCQSLKSYLATQAPAEVHLFHPRTSFTAERAKTFETALDRQLGREYGIKHHLTGDRAAGLHCAEYVTDALIDCRLLKTEHPARVSPASLVEGILKAEIYAPARTMKLTPVAEPRKPAGSWCGELWCDTKDCTRNCYLKLRGWFCCR